MSNLTNTKQRDILHTINNVEETHKQNSSEELVKRKHIDGTPFTIVTQEGKSFLTMGKYQISEAMDNEEEISIWLLENEWNVITTICGIIAEHVVKLNTKP